MRNCENFQCLTPMERAKMVGEIVHLLQTSNLIFREVAVIIKVGKDSGLFNGVEVVPIMDQRPELN